MCGRFTLNLAELADLKLPLGLDYVEITEWSPRYNIAPTQLAPVVTQNGSRVLRELRWGLVPRWAKDISIGARMINARVESIADKPSFRDAFRSRRCVVPATGYYEWKPVAGQKRKQPMWIHAQDGALLGLAGLWDRWHAQDGVVIDSFTIVTTDAKGGVEAIHDRMPLAMAEDDREHWLQSGALPPDALSEFVERAARRRLCAHPVNPRMNAPAVDDPACIEPAKDAGEAGGGGQLGLFD